MTTDQRMASKARAFQSVARSHLRSNWNAGSAVVLLGGDASPEIQHALLVALDSLLGTVVDAFYE